MGEYKFGASYAKHLMDVYTSTRCDANLLNKVDIQQRAGRPRIEDAIRNEEGLTVIGYVEFWKDEELVLNGERNGAGHIRFLRGCGAWAFQSEGFPIQ